jgi:hypothetical protein
LKHYLGKSIWIFLGVFLLSPVICASEPFYANWIFENGYAPTENRRWQLLNAAGAEVTYPRAENSARYTVKFSVDDPTRSTADPIILRLPVSKGYHDLSHHKQLSCKIKSTAPLMAQTHLIHDNKTVFIQSITQNITRDYTYLGGGFEPDFEPTMPSENVSSNNELISTVDWIAFYFWPEDIDQPFTVSIESLTIYNHIIDHEPAVVASVSTASIPVASIKKVSLASSDTTPPVIVSVRFDGKEVFAGESIGKIKRHFS